MASELFAQGSDAEHRDADSARLTRSEALLRRIEHLAGLGSFDWNPQSGELHWSDEHFRLWGIEPGVQPATIEIARSGVHPDDLARFERESAEARRRGGLIDTEYRVCRPDGSTIWVRARAEVTLGPDGRAERMVGTVLDITSLRAAEAALHRHDFIFNAITDPVSVIDADLVYHSVNDAWCRVTGLRREEVIGRRHRGMLDRVATEERLRALHTCIADGQPRRVRSHIDFDGNGARWWETEMYPYDAPGQQARLVVLLARDVDQTVRAQAALAAGVDNLRITLDATGDGIFASDAESDDQPLLLVNERILEMFRVAPELRADLTPARANAAAARFFVDPAADMARLRAVVAADKLVEDRLTLNDGRTLQFRCEPAFTAGRRVRVWTFRDITAEVQAQRALRESEAQQRALLEAFPGYIACIDAQARYTFVNPLLGSLLGQTSAALIGTTAREVAPPDLGDPSAARATHDPGGATLRYERTYPAPEGGDAKHVMYTLAPGVERVGGAAMWTLFGTDITSLKRTEAALIRARDEAEGANRAKSVFLSSMSHELRTPMNAVLGFAQLLAADPALGAPQLEMVQRILQGGHHLLALINDLLDLTRIESGRLDLRLEAVPLAELVAQCLTLVAPDAAQRGIVLSPCPDDLTAMASHAAPLAVRADRRRLQQVLLNLLGNAIKYNHPGGWVRLQWSIRGAQVHCSVSDGGPGIDAALHPRLFQVFERLDADRGGVEGTGIGLALCRRLVNLMHGEIGMESSPGRGSNFWFTLDRADAGTAIAPPAGATAQHVAREPAQVVRADGAPAPALPGARPGAPARRRILCIEDNPVNLLLIEAMVGSLPDTVAQGVAEPQVGLEMALADPPDLVLLDIQMPGMDGYEVLHRLRAAARTRALPVIAVSANAMPQDVARGLEVGFSAYLTKPVDLPALARAVDDALAPARPRD